MDLAIPVACAFALLSVLHVYWAVGGRAGAVAVVPECEGAPVFRPGPASTLVVAGLLAFSALLVLAHVGRGPAVFLPRWMVTLGVPVVAVVMLVRSVGDLRYVGFFKKVRDTRFAHLDTMYFSPIALALGAATAFVAWGAQ